MTDKSQMKHNINAAMYRHRVEIAELHVAHDFGWRALDYLKSIMKPSELSDAVLLQRHYLADQGNLTQTIDGEEVLVGKIDLTRLGLNKEQIAKIGELKAFEEAEVGRVGFAAAEAARRGATHPLDAVDGVWR